jgi:DNA-binding transcriptional MerR regulator
MDVQPVLISKLAILTGVTVATIRVYERRGLIAPLHRTSNGYRYYDPSLQEVIRVFGAAMSIGISLSEISEIFAAVSPLLREPTPAQARATAENAAKIHRRHIDAIDVELERLGKLRAVFVRRADYCMQQLAGPEPARIGAPTIAERRSRPGRIEYVRTL